MEYLNELYWPIYEPKPLTLDETQHVPNPSPLQPLEIFDAIINAWKAGRMEDDEEIDLNVCEDDEEAAKAEADGSESPLYGGCPPSPPYVSVRDDFDAYCLARLDEKKDAAVSAVDMSPFDLVFEEVSSCGGALFEFAKPLSKKRVRELRGIQDESEGWKLSKKSRGRVCRDSK